MKIALFRCDSSFRIGTGHIIRCMNLALHLRDSGYECHFLCQKLEGSITSVLRSQGFPVTEVSADIGSILDVFENIRAKSSTGIIEIFVLDHYGIDLELEKVIFDRVRKLIVLDDLGNREHFCHILVDYNYRSDYTTIYQQLPTFTRRFFGPQFAILRKEFYEIPHSQIRTWENGSSRILVFFGGSDEKGYSLQFLNCLRAHNTEFPTGVSWTLLLASSCRHLDEIRASEALENVSIEINSENIGRLMASHHLYFGSGGTITWERMHVGLTGVIFTVADNQFQIAKDLDADGFHVHSGHLSSINRETFIEPLKDMIVDQEKARSMSQKCSELTSKNNLQSLIEVIIA